MTQKYISFAATAALLATVLFGNYVTDHFGLIPVGFGLTATAGIYLAGATFVLRDTLQDAAGKRVTVVIIAVAAGLSFLVADASIALASAVAFLFAELADLAIYTPLRIRGYIRAAIASNIAGAFVDTVVFLAIAGFPIREAIAGQMVGKLAITAAAVALVVTVRATRQKVAA
ncbi:VUT family protein [Kocuria marina]|uniref:VUT family protein n=1 Tax=Kocuria marina TaxID=223184 RepID=UPI0019D0E22D|nr:VUT family protein [Kocuria indica]MBN6812938.1 VUT family protein [Kocuria indica]MBN6844663.1 VUT family protein [Kocuria indica]